MQSVPEQQFAFTVGNITGEGVTLVDKEYNVIQLPKSLLPVGSVSGSIIRMTLKRDAEMERKEEQQINALIEKLEGGEHVGDTIIGMEDDEESSARSEVKQKSDKKDKKDEKDKNDKKPETKPQIKQSVRVAEQVKVQQKPQTGMKKKPKIQQAQQQKPSTAIKQSPQLAQQIQKPAQRQKSASRRTSSAMKKIKPQSTQASS